MPLVEEATESYFPEFKAATLAIVATQGMIVGWCVTSAALLVALEPVTDRPVAAGIDADADAS